MCIRDRSENDIMKTLAFDLDGSFGKSQSRKEPLVKLDPSMYKMSLDETVEKRLEEGHREEQAYILNPHMRVSHQGPQIIDPHRQSDSPGIVASVISGSKQSRIMINHLSPNRSLIEFDRAIVVHPKKYHKFPMYLSLIHI
eukprot:TRINITY_DN7277_c0_g1_i2.p1 TRINITY_DN7277_c0_g1~~TRINITY_DN7277_c0_g1_i2.p1  ORF type:complete len:157 (+),score=15.42 TRINITY_DN7277_c0_g1_i2:51-473(+)